jgi:predicted nucleic acid-binding protein
VDGNLRYSELVKPIFRRAVEGSLEIVISAIAVVELLVGAFEGEAPRKMEERLMDLCIRHPNVRTEGVSVPIVVLGASIRAQTRVLVPDSLIAATSVVTECDAMVTNDKGFRKLAGIQGKPLLAHGPEALKLPPTLYLDEYLDS